MVVALDRHARRSGCCCLPAAARVGGARRRAPRRARPRPARSPACSARRGRRSGARRASSSSGSPCCRSSTQALRPTFQDRNARSSTGTPPRHLAARDGPHHEPCRGRDPRAPGRARRRRPRRPRDHLRPGGRRRTRASCGSRRSGSADYGGRSRPSARSSPAIRAFAASVLTYEDDRMSGVLATGRQRPDGPGLRPGPRRPRSPGPDGASHRGAGRRRASTPDVRAGPGAADDARSR